MSNSKELEKTIRQYQNKESDLKNYSHVVFNLKKSEDRDRLLKLFKDGKIGYVIDDMKEQKEELRLVNDPKLIKDSIVGGLAEKSESSFEEGVWVYYPWKKCLSHLLSEKDFDKLRVSRNQNLITKNEQKIFSKLRIGIAGLNVGNPAAICLALEGGGRYFKFADNDVLSVSNLNRFRAGLCDLGVNKATLTARQVYEINPFLQIDVFDKGVEQGCEEKFLSNPRLDVLVEETDNLSLKISIRQKAKKLRIPVVMVTGNAENVLIDIERFDLDSELPLLSGKIDKTVIKDIINLSSSDIDFKKKVFLARDFIGEDYLDDRLKSSFLEVGASLAGIPQLSESSFLRGAAVCYVIRKIALGEKMPSGRYDLRLDNILN